MAYRRRWRVVHNARMSTDAHETAPDLATLGPLVRTERLRRGLTPLAAGQLGGISKAGWINIENGTARRIDHWRYAVARAFDWPDDWPEHPPVPPAVSQRDDAVLAAFERLASTMLATMAAMQTQIDELRRAVDRLAPAGR
jgi:hypothetical protein